MTQSIYKKYVNTRCNFDVQKLLGEMHENIQIKVRMYIHTLNVSMNTFINL